jgi:ssDNA-binding Zn-finger/Zn-ribbon topoisomerase 1
MKIKPCPFCGHPGTLVEGQFGDWFIHCINIFCGVRPCTEFEEVNTGHIIAKKEQ